eukprot:gene1213-1323_t
MHHYWLSIALILLCWFEAIAKFTFDKHSVLLQLQDEISTGSSATDPHPPHILQLSHQTYQSEQQQEEEKEEEERWGELFSPSRLASIEVLDLSHSDLTSSQLHLLASKLPKMSRLHSLLLDGCALSLDDLRLLCYSLRRLPSLRFLSLTACQLRDGALDCLAFLSKAQPTLTHCDLSCNHLTADSLPSLEKLLEQSLGQQLRLLDLSYNPLGDGVVRCLARTLARGGLPNLRYLYLRQIATKGSKAWLDFFQALQLPGSKSPLCGVDIAGNCLIAGGKDQKQSTRKTLLSSALRAFSTSKTKEKEKETSSVLTTVKQNNNKRLKKKKTVKQGEENGSEGRIVKKKKVKAVAGVAERLAVSLLQLPSQMTFLGLAKTGLDDRFASAFKRLNPRQSPIEVDVRLNGLSQDQIESVRKAFSSSSSLIKKEVREDVVEKNKAEEDAVSCSGEEGNNNSEEEVA